MKRSVILIVMLQLIFAGAWAICTTSLVKQDVVETIEPAQISEAQEEILEENIVEEPISTEDTSKIYAQEKPIKHNNRSYKTNKANIQETESTESGETTKKKKSENPDTGLYIFGALTIYLLYRIVRFYTRRRCFKCGKPWSMKVVKKEFCGTQKTTKTKTSDGYIKAKDNKYKITRECKYCGHTNVYYDTQTIYHTFINR